MRDRAMAKMKTDLVKLLNDLGYITAWTRKGAEEIQRILESKGIKTTLKWRASNIPAPFIVEKANAETTTKKERRGK